jgi:hypothetical protein
MDFTCRETVTHSNREHGDGVTRLLLSSAETLRALRLGTALPAPRAFLPNGHRISIDEQTIALPAAIAARASVAQARAVATRAWRGHFFIHANFLGG